MHPPLSLLPLLPLLPPVSSLLLFVGAALALLLVPGPAVLYITTRAMSQGRRAGLASALGVAAGSTVHVLAAALGLSALLASSALAFSVVKYAGAAYLVYLGIRRIVSRETGGATAATPPAPLFALFALFRQGVLVNLLNPKTALFFLAFLPQFVDPTRGGTASQVVFLGLLFSTMGLVTDSLYALAADRVAAAVKRSPRAMKGGRYVSGGVYIGLGLVTAFSGVKK
jgi:threonine/homoserine/homoserine lactone efflux protein